MSDNRFVWEGLDDLKEALRTLPDDLAAEGGRYVVEAAQGAEADVRQEYEAHRVTGNLARRLSVATSTSAFGAAAQVKSAAPHAWMFENGTQARHYVTKSGATHRTGAMWGKTAQPPSHVFVRSMQKWRRRMVDNQKAMLERSGLQVTETA